MTREEERIKQIEQFASQCYEDGEKYSAFISGAILADNNPVKVWHDASEEPKGTYIVLCDGLDNMQWVVDYIHIDMAYANWEDYADAIKVNRLAYISDLLPKGGER